MEQDIKQKILETAEGLFMKLGVRSVSMDDVANQLVMSKKTLYQHFENKDELITSVAKQHLKRETQEFKAIASQASNAIQELFMIAKCIRRNIKQMNPTLLHELRKYHPAAWKTYLDFKQQVIMGTIVDNLRRGITEGYFRPEIDPTILAIVRVEMVQLIFDEQIFPKERYKLSEVQMVVFDHFIHGLFSEKGKELYNQLQKAEIAEK